ncbi:MAG: gliding motility-associated C-terminal domain-containing protein [Flavobacteriales bacterium]|nr:gliding motility-associated C-terminal domain-containing protein [Flavobacteriales bacterium]
MGLRAQVFPFTSGPIPLCDTSTFTATVSGVGTLITPDGWSWGSFLENVVINITTNHPQTLSISLTSPGGTTLLLSAFNGAGGQNYTNTNFNYWGGGDITAASAPFSGNFTPQGGFLGVFDWENADGTWTITVIDTACVAGAPGPGGPWQPGWFNGGAGSGAFSFGFASPPPPCDVDMGYFSTAICAGETVDVLEYFETNYGGWGLTFTVYSWQQVVDPHAVGVAGSYYIEAVDWTGCYYYGGYDITLSADVALGPDQQVMQCSGDGPVDLTALFSPSGLSFMNWDWNGAPITLQAAAAVSQSGTYQLVASNQGCSDTALVEVTIHQGPALGADQSVSACEGSSIDLTTVIPPGPGASAWTLNGSPVADPTAVTIAGDYALSTTDSEGCSDTAMVLFSIDPIPVLGADQSHMMCANASFDLTGLYDVAGWIAEWQLDGLPVPMPGSVHDAGVYTLVAQGPSGCSDTALVSLSAWSGPALGPDVNAEICTGSTADLGNYYGTVGLSAQWTTGGSIVADPSAVSSPGTYALVATDTNGCADTANVLLAVNAGPALGPDHQVSACDGTHVDLTTLYAVGADEAIWRVNGIPVMDASAVSEGGMYVLSVVNAAGCSDSATVELTMMAAPELGSDAEAMICEGASYDLTSVYSTAGLGSQWFFDNAPFNDLSNAAEEGAYELVATNGSGCTDTAMVMLTVNPNPALGDDRLFTLCPWQTVDLSTAFPVSGLAASYLMLGAPVVDPTAVSDSGTYVITVVDVNGCADEALAVVVPVECLCEADFVTSARCTEDFAQFTAVADSAMLSARWEFDGWADEAEGISAQVMLRTAGDVRVTMHAELSCGTYTAQRTVTMVDCADSCAISVPNAFTPNNDDRNDAWAWVGECRPDEFEIAVFNRFGELVFASSDPADSWDGSYKGTVSQEGVYVYHLSYRLPYQDRQERYGHLTLLR